MAERQKPLDARKGYAFGYSESTNAAGFRAAEEIYEETGNWAEAVAVASHEIDGAGEDLTVESMATCRDLFGNFVPGLTTDDSLEPRTDVKGASDKLRELAAMVGADEGGQFLLEKDTKYFMKKHAKRLLQAARFLGIAKDLVPPKGKLAVDSYSWDQLREIQQQVTQVFQERIGLAEKAAEKAMEKERRQVVARRAARNG